MANPAIVVDFIANTKDLQKGFNQATGKTGGFASKLGGIGKAALAAAGAAGLGALTATLKTGIDEYTEATKVAAQTNAVLKSTGGAAGVTAKHVSDLAGALMSKSGVDDEAIQSGENLLLTFTKVQNKAGAGNAIFDRATKTMLDMSVALGQDTKTSALQLGKALNNPVKGVSALQRVGVSFTEAQKAQIAAMVKSGDTMGAQKAILKELNSEFGGSAAAAGKTLPGQLNILKQSFNNLAGEIIKAVVPAFAAIAKFFVKNPALAKAVVIGVLALAGAMVALNAALAVSAALSAGILGPLALVAAGLAAIVAVGIIVYKNWDKISGAMKRAMATIKIAVSSVFNWIKGNWPLLVGILGGPLGIAAALVIRNWNNITAATRNAWNAVKSATTSAWNAVRSTISSVVGAISSRVNSVVAAVKNAFKGLGTWVSGWASGTFSAIVSRVAGFFTRITDGVRAAVNHAKDALNSLAAFVSNLAGRISGAASRVANAFKGPLNAVIGAWNSLGIPRVAISLPSKKILGKTIGGGSFGFGPYPFPDIPRLASGGVVSSPTLALVGEGPGREIVAPEALLREIAADRQITVRVYIGDTELRGLVRTEITDSNTGIARALLAG